MWFGTRIFHSDGNLASGFVITGFGREASYLMSTEYDGLNLSGVTVRVFKFGISSQ